MSVIMTSNETVPAIVLPAIQVEIGELKVHAVLSTVGASAIHEKVVKKINKISRRSVKYMCVKTVDLVITIDGKPMTMEITAIMPDLYVDMVLGYDFLLRCGASLHFGLRTLKWKYYDKVIITEFVGGSEHLRAISGGSNEGDKKSKVLQQKPVNMPTSSKNGNEQSSASTSRDVNIPTVFVRKNDQKSENPQSKNAKKKKGKKLQGSANKDSSCPSADNQMNPSTKSAPNKSNLGEGPNNWVKVSIIDNVHMTKYTSEYYGYFGIRWENSGKTHIDFEPWDNVTCHGIQFGALKYVFEQAAEDEIDCLHILSNLSDRVIDAMMAYQNNDKKKLSNLKPGCCDEFSYGKDYRIYAEACKALDKIKFIKYECASNWDAKRMRELIQEISNEFYFQLRSMDLRKLRSSDSSDFDEDF